MIQKDRQLFLNDYYMPGMINASTFRTEVKKGKIRSSRLPSEGNFTIITRDDIPGKKDITFFGNSIPILAGNEINYPGEPLYIIAYDNDENYISALKNIKITCEEEAPLSFRRENIIPPQIVYRKTFTSQSNPEANNGTATKKSGKEKKAGDDNSESLSAGELLFQEDTFYARGYNSRYCEPFGAIAQPVKNGIVIYTVSQWQNHVRKSVAEALDISQKNVSIVNTALSSPLEGRIWYPSLIASQAAVAAFKTGKPVKLLLSRHETYFFSPRQHPFRINFRTYFHKTGKLHSMKINLEIDCGAYPIVIDEIYEKAFLSASGLYDCPDIVLNLSLLKTSKPPTSFISGFNFSQLTVSLEKHVSAIARRLRLSQAQWRKTNILAGNFNKSFFTNPQEDASRLISSGKSCALSVIDSVVNSSDFERKYASYELMRENMRKNRGTRTSGIGLSLSFLGNTIPLKSMEKDKLSIRLLLDSKSNLNIYTSTVPDGINNYDIWKNTAGTILEIPPENIFVIPHQTDLSPASTAYPFSKGLGGFSEVLKKSCQSLQKKRFRNPLPIEVTTSISLNALNRDDFSWGAAVVELSVDNLTYEIDIKSIWCSFDCGQVLNREIIDKTVYSGIIDSLNWLYGAEYLPEDRSRIIQSDNSWQFFNIPIYSEYLNTMKKNRSLSIGDLPLSLIPGAYYSAIVQALGCDIDSIPVKIDKIDNIFKKNRQR